jgi:hypothetical protein
MRQKTQSAEQYRDLDQTLMHDCDKGKQRGLVYRTNVNRCFFNMILQASLSMKRGQLKYNTARSAMVCTQEQVALYCDK